MITCLPICLAIAPCRIASILGKKILCLFVTKLLLFSLFVQQKWQGSCQISVGRSLHMISATPGGCHLWLFVQKYLAHHGDKWQAACQFHHNYLLQRDGVILPRIPSACYLGHSVDWSVAYQLSCRSDLKLLLFIHGQQATWMYHCLSRWVGTNLLRINVAINCQIWQWGTV